MSLIIDVSAYQGKIDFDEIAKQDIDRIILRTTTQNGKIDTRFMENLNGALQKTKCTIDGYKFAYTREYVPAYMECIKTLELLQDKGALKFLNMFWLDLEKFGNADFTTEQADATIKGYADACKEYNVKMGLYFNYNYAKNIVNDVWHYIFPLWIARYNTTLGDVSPWQPAIWQYTSSGSVGGISGNVDISCYCDWNEVNV